MSEKENEQIGNTGPEPTPATGGSGDPSVETSAEAQTAVELQNDAHGSPTIIDTLQAFLARLPPQAMPELGIESVIRAPAEWAPPLIDGLELIDHQSVSPSTDGALHYHLVHWNTPLMDYTSRMAESVINFDTEPELDEQGNRVAQPSTTPVDADGNRLK